MRIKEITGGAVTVELDPGQCLFLAEACGRAAETAGDGSDSRSERAIYELAAAHFEALALVGSASNYVAPSSELLAEWTLPILRREWGFVTTRQEVAG